MTQTTQTNPVILVIDDDEANRTVLEVILQRCGYAPALAENGYKGISMARTLQPALILLDYFMPDADGFEILTKIKQDEQIKAIPVVIFTVLAREESRQQALKLGATAYVTKPFDVGEVVAIIEKVLR